ncbi:MAG: proteasome endopeptidase complex, archaeal, beta subunit [Thermofilum sp. ex4484_15]|nr:MAG: proteasome endopeptidase complex, archaeal, beta subunit [Thermofilum sp. ex4484_15]
MATESYLPGATTIGLRCKDGVILASEKRVSYGFTLVSKAGKKVFKINNRLGLACAGMIADMQAIARTLAAEVNLYELENGRIMPIKSAAKLLSVILFNRRYTPYLTETLIGGIDNEGPHLFVLDPIGSLIEDDYAVLGTGAKIAIGIIETSYKKDVSVKEGKDLAIRAIKAATSRDAISGDGIDVLSITNQGAEEETIPLAPSI